MKQMRQPRSKECCYLHWMQEFLYEITFTAKMPGEFLRERTSIITESSKAEETSIAQGLYLCLPCIFGLLLDLFKPWVLLE